MQLMRRQRRCELDGRTVAITGGAGGLGLSLTQALLAKGARVALLDIDEARVASAATELGHRSKVSGWQTDVRDHASLSASFDRVASHFGGIDVVVAGAGILPPFQSLARTEDELWTRVIDINLSGVWRTLSAGAPYVGARRGHLVAMSSMLAFLHPPLLGSYAASKAGVWALCNALRVELAPAGVSVGSVHPIMFHTPMIDAITDDRTAQILSNGFKGPGRPLPVDAVARAVVRGIERRSAHVVCPGSMRAAAVAPGLFQDLSERFALTPKKVRQALLAEQTRDRPSPVPHLGFDQ